MNRAARLDDGREHDAIDEKRLGGVNAQNAADVAGEQYRARTHETREMVRRNGFEETLKRRERVGRAKAVNRFEALDFATKCLDLFTCGGVRDDEDHVDIRNSLRPAAYTGAAEQ